MIVHLSIDYIEVTLVALPRLSRGYFAGVILQVSRPGWGRIKQSLYVLKLRATIIGYVPLLVVYGSFKPLLGETYLLHSGAHISSLGLLVFWLYIFLGVCSLYVSWPLGLWLLEYIYALLSSGPFIFSMPGILHPSLVLV